MHWDQLKEWRKEQRAQLIEARIQARRIRRKAWADAITPLLEAILEGLAACVVGAYWPFRGEFDARPLLGDLLDRGFSVALPAVVKPSMALEFRRWVPGEPLVPGVWKIPIPEKRDIVTPQLLLVPVVGFDAACFRLGYGGGYYDRTLAALHADFFAIGIGHEHSRLDIIHPQPHDVAMDVIVTERLTQWKVHTMETGA